MAHSSTIFKVSLQVSDLDRHYYQTHNLTVALHPSETELRMMVRILVFALNASDELEFTKGISTDEEPDLWIKTLTGDIDSWIEVGQPSLKRIKKASNQSNQIKVYTFSGRGADIWHKQNKADFSKLDKLQLINLPADQIEPLSHCVNRTMSLQCTIQEGTIWFGGAQHSVEVTPHVFD
ncbi:MAG: YaeQ family protein [Arenicellales bacterium]